MEEALKSATLMILAVPSAAARGVLQQAVPYLPEGLSPKGLSPEGVHPVGIPIVCVSKGIETGALMLMSQVMKEVLPAPCSGQIAVLSGPSFAVEVCRHQPTAVTLASEDQVLAERLARVFITSYFKVFTSTDIIGVQIGGALKNVIALAVGMAEGLGFGHNARSALIARGLAEMSLLGTAMGADPRTTSGLSGLGDLVLTCLGGLSRNKSVGLKIGQGMKLSQVLKEMRTVAEGVQTAQSAHGLAQKLGVRVPIMERVYAILFKDTEPRQALSEALEEGSGGPE